MNPPTGLTLTGYYSKGDWDGYTNVQWTSTDKINCFYRIEIQTISPVAWVWLADVPWEKGVYGMAIRYAHASQGGPKAAFANMIRITTVDIAGISPEASATIAIPTTMTPYHVAASSLTPVCFGDIGGLRGQLNLGWHDLSRFVRNGEITLTKYGVTSPYVKQTLFHETFNGTPTDLIGVPNFIYIYLKLLPPGITLYGDPPDWDVNNPPSNDPEAPQWVVEGDTLTLTVTTYIDDSDTPMTTSFSFTYYRTTRFYQVAEAATLNQAFSLQLEIIQDPWLPDVLMDGTFTAGAGMPPGLTISSSGLISGTPTATGIYRPQITCWNLDASGSWEAIQIVVNVINVPVILAPPSGVPLPFGTPYPPQYSLYATNHPTSYSIVSGVLPVGLSFNTTTGVISGTPGAIESPHDVVFKATNAAGDSAPFTCTFSVVLYVPPTINSPNAATFYLEDTASYQITTNVPALTYRAYDLPSGLALIGSVITGIPVSPPGTYPVDLQASNRWGWGSLFALQITLAIHAPEISSPLTAEALVDEPFLYTIAASYHPTSYGAVGLPNGVSANTATGVISGVPTVEGDYQVALSAVNAGGIGNAVLALTVGLPPVPVIDTTATHGRAITVEMNTPFVFQPAATHNPTSWTCDPVPDGLALDSSTGRLAGQFQAAGLLGLVFVASNRGGDSDPATFYFLVILSKKESQILNVAASIIDIWVSIDDGTVTVGSTDETAGSQVIVKRGDQITINCIFHHEGVPADLLLSTLVFGAKVDYESDYVVYADSIRRIEPGKFRLFPDFSKNNNELDSLLIDKELKLIGEVQWVEVIQGYVPGVSETLRRSSATFDVVIQRDIVHPD